MKVLQVVLLLAGIWLAGELAWTVHELRPNIAVTLENVDRTVIIAGAAAGNLERASRAWEQASKQQASETTRAMSSVSAAAKQLTGFISRTDNSLNAELLPTLTDTVAKQNTALLETEKQLQGNLSEMASTTQQLQTVLSHADERITDPSIKLSLDNVAESSANLAASTKDVKQVLDKFRETYLKAPNMAYAVFKELLSIGSQGVQFFLKK